MFSQVKKEGRIHPFSIDCVLSALVLTLCLPSQAVEISFDGTGYSAVGTQGTVLGIDGKIIKGQGGSTKWDDFGTDFAVVANAGKGGDNNGLVSTTNQSASKSVLYTPSLSELGIAAFTARSIQHFSMDVRLIDNGTNTTQELYRLGIGLIASPTFPIEVQIKANSDVSINMNSTPKLILTGAMPEGGNYRTISGTIDYAHKRVEIFLDGLSQGSYAFTGTYTSYGQFKLNVRVTSTTVGIALDNLSAYVTKIPDATVFVIK